ncbi:SoxR reducing system RseC family protein [Corallincola spongiicola]|uniref:Fis family transcriptional regulator n=1 Tax=Corallincola spongiicola TaxID=2520508 RepID=A0ABY1WRI8_9GAMM|nr:SoxR reducing system RseC family protein [Corallincola spongiicola]TAA47346.1 hypothetical protein EXY25_08930 [Corallincola spongiicola]
MFVEEARVVRCHDGWVELESLQKSACDACSDKGCGNGVVAKAFGHRLHRMLLPDPGHLQQGQTVRVALPEKTLITGAVLVYLSPIAGALFGAIIISMLQQLSGSHNEPMQIVAAVLGGVAGWLFARHRARQYERDPACQIKILQGDELPLTLSSTQQDSDV